MRRSIAPWVALAGAVILTFAAAAVIDSTARARDRLRFSRAVRGAQDRIAARFDKNVDLLRGLAALLAAEPALDEQQFRAWTARLDLPAHYPGLQGVGYARRVRRTESAQVENELQSRGFAGLRIWPDLGREERTAVVWLEPLDQRNRAAIGYDMLSEPVRREAMERARDLAGPALSGKVTLVQEIETPRQPGFLLYVPVYRGGPAPPTPAERREALIGWAYSPFRAEDLFNAIFAAAEPGLEFRAYDGDREDPQQILRDRPLPKPSGRRLSETVPFTFAGHRWTLVFAEPLALEAGPGPALIVLLIGGAISGLVFLLARREAGARERAERAVGELSNSLRERDRFEERLREEGRVNSILRRLGISLAAELDPDRLAQLVTDEAAALTGAEVGAMFDARRRRLALAGSLHSPELSLGAGSETVERTWRGERAVRIDELDGPVFAGGSPPVRSYLAVPVISRTGEVLAGLFFGHGAPARFTAHHERLMLGLAAQASIALDNARLLRDLQEADRRKNEFLAVLGHELRNPLAPVVTALDVARRDPDSAERQLAVIERQARHMVRIVDDLLDVSRISRGKIELRRQLLAVHDALARAAETVAPLASAREQRLRVVPPQEALLVEADPVRLEQILGNLLTNAIKYTPEHGEIELSAVRREKLLELRVRDTGIGIPAEAQKVLFEPFVQVPGARDYSTGGLGIGLALVKGLVDLHGGTVSVHSEGPGKGALFTVSLPGVVQGSTPREVRPVVPRARSGRILVVDDNVDAAATLAEAMRLDGHDVQIAHDGPAAIEGAVAFGPEVVLLDIGLPGMDGYEVVQRLRNLPRLAGALIVALTGFGQESDRLRALQAGFDEHLVKPVDLDTVHRVLLRRLGAA